jgi:hypothetical protein
MATAPSSVAGIEERPPMNAPIGVLTAATIYTSFDIIALVIYAANLAFLKGIVNRRREIVCSAGKH